MKKRKAEVYLSTPNECCTFALQSPNDALQQANGLAKGGSLPQDSPLRTEKSVVWLLLILLFYFHYATCISLPFIRRFRQLTTRLRNAQPQRMRLVSPGRYGRRICAEHLVWFSRYASDGKA